MKTKLAFDSAITKAIRGAMPQPLTQAAVWLGVRDDRNKLVAFVRDRTGTSGNELTKQVYEYETEMKKRYG